VADQDPASGMADYKQTRYILSIIIIKSIVTKLIIISSKEEAFRP